MIIDDYLQACSCFSIKQQAAGGLPGDKIQTGTINFFDFSRRDDCFKITLTTGYNCNQHPKNRIIKVRCPL